MNEEKKEEYKIKNILEILKPVEAEPTLELFDQFIKIQFILKDPLSVQVVLDRIHKIAKYQSKPLGYLHFSSYMQLLELAKQFLTTATVMALVSQRNFEAGDFVISNSLDNAFLTIKTDAMRLVKICLEEIRKRIEGG